MEYFFIAMLSKTKHLSLFGFKLKYFFVQILRTKALSDLLKQYESSKGSSVQLSGMGQRKETIPGMLQKSAFVSGKYIASLKSRVSHILA